MNNQKNTADSPFFISYWLKISKIRKIDLFPGMDNPEGKWINRDLFSLGRSR